MTRPGIGGLASHVLRSALAATCRCAARRWRIDASRNFAGVTVRAEIRSE